MARTPKTVHFEDETIAQVEALAFKDERTFSAMTDKLVREGIKARSVQKTKPATD